MEEKYPKLRDRFQSTFIDTILVVFLMLLAAGVLDKYGSVPDWIRITLFVGLFLAYEPVCTTLGFTLGNYLKGIRVRKNADTTHRINIAQALLRYPVKILLGWVSFLTIHSNPKKRAIHDLVSGSVMIKI